MSTTSSVCPRERVLDMLKNRPHRISYKEIADETGLTFSWLRAFGRGIIAEPSAVKLHTLETYLNSVKK